MTAMSWKSQKTAYARGLPPELRILIVLKMCLQRHSKKHRKQTKTWIQTC